MTRIYNFSAGPAMLPEAVMRQAQAEFLDWQSSGMSVVEISHRSKPFEDLLQEAEHDLRDLLKVPKNYHVIFLAAPARAQFAMIPMNLLRGKTTADYIDTGIWSHMAAEEGKKYCEVNVAASNQNHLSTIPARSTWQLNPDAAYVHYTSNETINGLEFPGIPDVGNVPLVVDMTSSLFSRTLDVSRFGLIYAGCQKNFAPSGMTLIIVREDLLGNALPFTPTVLDYQIQVDNHSLYYTPCSFSCYFAGLTFKWLKQQGGLAEIEKINRRKAAKLYHYIDQSNFYTNSIDPTYRSIMNIPFSLANPDLDQTFLKEAEKNGLTNLKGHRLVGGMRASLYNAMPEEGVDALVEFMQGFTEEFVNTSI